MSITKKHNLSYNSHLYYTQFLKILSYYYTRSLFKHSNSVSILLHLLNSYRLNIVYYKWHLLFPPKYLSTLPDFIQLIYIIFFFDKFPVAIMLVTIDLVGFKMFWENICVKG